MAVDRFSITMDPELGKAVRQLAEAEGMTVSAWIAAAAEERVGLGMLKEALDFWEAEYGAPTEEELAAADAFMQDVEQEIRQRLKENKDAAA